MNKNFRCLICDGDITDDDFEYEDYYAVYRGHNNDKEQVERFICFDCYLRKNNIVINKNYKK